MIRTSFRLPLPLIQRLDAIAADLRKRQIGKVSRADVLRMLIETGLEHVERQPKRTPGAKPSKPSKPASAAKR